MQQLPLQAIPNQSFSLSLDGNQWDIVIKSEFENTSVTLTKNGVALLENTRAVPGSFIIPAQYEEDGNFFFITQNFEIPLWSQFGVTQYLIYVSPDELAAADTPFTLPVTASDFNPIAALPLRFSPQGYT